MDKNELKNQALLERISSLTTQLENQVADLRVELTITSQERDQLKAELDSLKSELENLRYQNVEASETPNEEA